MELLLIYFLLFKHVVSAGWKRGGPIAVRRLQAVTGSAHNAVYPLNKGNALTFAGTDKLFSKPTVLPVFYGGGTYWDTKTVQIFTDTLPLLSENYYFEPVFALISKKIKNPDFKTVKPIIYYGPQMFSSHSSQHKAIHDLLSNSKVYDSVDKGNTFLLLFLDPKYSKPSHFKLESGAAFDEPNNGFCGLHTYTQFKDKKYPYALIGNGGKNCQWNSLGSQYSLPNEGHIDMLMSIYLHELSEMLSNPFGGGYMDNQYLENGDKCVGYIGGVDKIQSSNKIFNMIVGNYKFLVQTQYDPQTDSCPRLIYSD
jgi:hypothetical protein